MKSTMAITPAKSEQIKIPNSTWWSNEYLLVSDPYRAPSPDTIPSSKHASIHFHKAQHEIEKTILTSTTTSLEDLIDQVPTAVKMRKIHDIDPGSKKDPVMQLLRQTKLPPEEWSRFALFDSARPYTRNLIATDYSTYTLLLLCWNPMQESPVHDHPCDGCWLQVLQGTVQEWRYNRQLKCTGQDKCREGEIAYITDSIGYHKIGNPTLTPSVSLHLYAPPIQECRVWPTQNDGTLLSSPCTSTTCHYSEFGRRL